MQPLCFYYHPDFARHEMGANHPESPERVSALLEYCQGLNAPFYPPRLAERGDLLLAHEPKMIDEIFHNTPQDGYYNIDSDTTLNPFSLNAALYAVGAGLTAVDNYTSYRHQFCLTRPPGHHSESWRAMGFCLFSNIAIAAIYAVKQGLERVVICDFDVHHGNGTQDCVKKHPQIQFYSSHQMPLYPGTGYPQEVGEHGTIHNMPLPGGCDGRLFMQKWQGAFDEIRQYKPQLLMVSAGFDAHRADPLAGCKLKESDYYQWGQLGGQLASSLNIPIISMLEGGYNIPALVQSCSAYIKGINDHAH